MIEILKEPVILNKTLFENIKTFILIVSNCLICLKTTRDDSDCKVPAESDREPVEDFYDRDKADSKAETAKPSKAGDEVEPGHLWGSLKLCT